MGFRVAVSKVLIVTFLLQLVAPVMALPGRVQEEDPSPRRQQVRRSGDPQVEKVLGRIRAPLQPAMSVPVDSHLLPELLESSDPQLLASNQSPGENEEPAPESTPSPTPSDTPTPRRFPVPNYTPTPSGWDCYTPSPSPSPGDSKKDSDKKHSPQDDSSDPPDEPADGPAKPDDGNSHDDDGKCDDIDRGEDRSDDCHHRNVKAQLAQIVLPTDVGSPIHEWSRRTAFNGPLFGVTDTSNPSVFSLDYALIHKKIYPLTNPGTHQIIWDFISPNPAGNKSGRHSAASIAFIYRSQGRLLSSPVANYRVQASIWDNKSPFGRTIELESLMGQLSSYKAFAGVTARDLGQWTFVESVDGQRTTSHFSVVDPPDPSAEWSRRVENRWETIIAPFAAYVNDEWLSRKKTLYFPEPTTAPLGQQCAANRRTVVEWNWRARRTPDLNTTSLNSFMSVRMVYRTTGTNYSLATYVFDDAYRNGRLYRQQVGSGTLASAPLAWGTGLPDYGNLELEETINGVQTELFTLEGRRIDAVAVSKGRFYVDNGPLEFNVQVNTYPLASPLKSGRWILDLREQTTGEIVYSVTQPFTNPDLNGFLSYRVLWDGKNKQGQAVPLGTRVRAEVTVKGDRDPAATLAAIPNTASLRKKGLRQVPERQTPHPINCPHCHKHQGGQGPGGGAGVGNVTYNPDGSYGTFPEGSFDVADIYVDANGVLQWPPPAGFAPGVGKPGDTWIIASADPAQGFSHVNLVQIATNLRQLYQTPSGAGPLVNDRFQESPIGITNLGQELLARLEFVYIDRATGAIGALGAPTATYIHNLNGGYSFRVVQDRSNEPVPTYGSFGTLWFFDHRVDTATVVHTPALESSLIELLSGASRTVATNYYGVPQALGAADVASPTAGAVESDIDIGSGELRTGETDLAIATAGLPLRITRHYVAHTEQTAFTNAATFVQFFIGKCVATGDIFHTHADNWIWSFQEDLELDDFAQNGDNWVPMKITHRWADGAEDAYRHLGGGKYASIRPDVVSSIELVAPDTYELTLKSKVRKRFQRFAEIPGQPNYYEAFLKRSNHCYLVQERDRNNNPLNYHWDSSGIRLTSVDDGRRTLVNCTWEDRASSTSTRFGVQAYYFYLNPVVGITYQTLFTGPKSELTLTSLKSITDLAGRQVTYDYQTPPISARGFANPYVELRFLNHVVQPGGRTIDYNYLDNYTGYSPAFNPYYWKSDLVQPGWAFNAPVLYSQLIKTKLDHQLRSVAVNGVIRNIFARHDYDTATIDEVNQPGVGAVRVDNIHNNPAFDASSQRITTLPEVAQPKAQAWNFQTDQLTRVTNIADPNQDSQQLTFDIANNLTELVDQLGKQSVCTFDSRRNLLTSRDELGHVTLLQPNANDDVISVTDARGNISKYGYDTHSNVISALNPENHSTIMTYNSQGKLLTYRDSLENTWVFDYDPDGFLIGKTAPASADYPASPHWTYGMDILKRRTSVTNPLQRTVNYRFDDRDRLVSTILPATSGQGLQTGRPPAEMTTDYTLDDLVSKTTDSLGRVTKYSYDDFLRLILVLHPGGTTTELTYDGFNNVHSSKNESGQITTYDYDSLNRAKVVHYPGAGDESFDFDAAGNLKVLHKTDGSQVQYTFDDARRLTLVDGGATQIAYKYDEINRLSVMTDNQGDTTYTYSPGSNLRSILKPHDQKITFGYDNNDRRISMLDPQNEKTDYRYNELGQLKHVQFGSASADFAYDVAGNMVHNGFGNGMESTQSYDERNQLLNKTYTHPSQGPLLTVQYSHDQIGRREAYRRIDPQGTQTRVYTYRVKGELIHSHTTNQPAAGPTENSDRVYDFDNNFNRTVFNSSSYAVNAADQMLQGGGVTQQYDGAGSVANLHQNGTDTRFRYDFRDQLLSADSPSQSIAYRYDGDNLRVQKNVNGVVTNYLTVAGQVIKEYDSSYNPTQAYLPGVAWRHNNNDTDWNYYLTDGLGSVLAITDQTGAITARYDFGDYGEELSATGPLAQENTFRYTGEQFDAETGFYYLRNRYYQPQLGRFLQRDPVRQSAGPNMMAYCSGDPINNADPDGLKPSGPAMSAVLREQWRKQDARQAQIDAYSAWYHSLPGHQGAQDISVDVLFAGPVAGKVLSKSLGYAISRFTQVPIARSGFLGAGIAAADTDMADFLANLATREDGYFNFAMHAGPERAGMLLGDGTWAELTVDEVASAIKHTPGYVEGEPVSFLGCKSGSLPNGFGARLAQRLGAKVRAPIGDIEHFPNGKYTVEGGYGYFGP